MPMLLSDVYSTASSIHAHLLATLQDGGGIISTGFATAQSVTAGDLFKCGSKHCGEVIIFLISAEQYKVTFVIVC